jgi:RluA family pseudouridine synthase
MIEKKSFFDLHDHRKIIAKPYDHEFHVRIPDIYYGMTIDEYYCKRFPYKTRDVWLASMAEGRIMINGRQIEPTHVIRANDILDSFVKNIIEPPINPEWQSIYEDDDLEIINKPGHLAVHPTGRFYKHSYVQLMAESHPNRKIYLLHRLDVETSGILIVGKTNRLAVAFLKMFTAKEVHKKYMAIVKGHFPAEGIIVDQPIGQTRDSSISVKMAVNGKDAKEATSKFELIEHRSDCSLIRCIPITGRTNQLRVHLEHVGFPILGDKVYCNDDSIFISYHENGETPELKEKLILNRQALHAYQVSFLHPFKNELMTFEAPFPSDINYHPINEPEV